MKENNYISIDEIEYPDDYESIYCDALYQGKPFTGTAVEDANGVHTEWLFVNGKGHGRWFSVFENGQLQEEIILEYGKEISSDIWTKDGVLIEHFQAVPFKHTEFYDTGKAKYVEEDNGWMEYFESGIVKRKYIYKDGIAMLYAEDGEWLLKHHASGEKYLIMDEKNIDFNDEYISNHYLELLKKDITPLMINGEYENFYMYYILWLKNKSKKERNDFIIKMIECDEPAIKYNGINLAREYKVKKAVAAIENERYNNCIPKMHGYHGYAWTISQLARVALGELNKLSFFI